MLADDLANPRQRNIKFVHESLAPATKGTQASAKVARSRGSAKPRILHATDAARERTTRVRRATAVHLGFRLLWANWVSRADAHAHGTLLTAHHLRALHQRRRQCTRNIIKNVRKSVADQA